MPVPIVYCASQDLSLIAKLGEKWRVSATIDATYDQLRRRLEVAARTGEDMPAGIVIADNLSLNHSRPSTMALVKYIRDTPLLQPLPVVVVDTTGRGDLVVNAATVLPTGSGLADGIATALRLEPLVASGCTFTVFSVKGGVGKTTLGGGFVLALKRRYPQARILWLDMDLQDGDVRTATGMDAGAANLEGIVENIGTLTTDVVMAHVLQHPPSGIYVILAPPTTVLLNVQPNEWVDLLNLLRRQFDYIVIDLDTTVNLMNLKLVAEADYVVGVTSPRAFDQEGAVRFKDVLGRALRDSPRPLAARVVLACNNYKRRYGPRRQVREEIGEMFGLRVVGLIPYDEAVEKCQEKGGVFPTRGDAWTAVTEMTEEILKIVAADREAAQQTAGSGGAA